MEGRTVSHYRVLKKIGEGGMGQVYLAEDTSLDRKVALKFLPEHLHSDDVAHKRFLREAKSAAALDHPFICHIHEVGEADGKNFISMEYVEGETLRDRLEREPLTYREVLRMGSEIAEALQRAHEAGIVHRDLKPSNIMLNKEGRVKVMDFGLAKRVVVQDVGEQETTAALTKEGTTLGTVPYMSPEQLRGEEIDARSDIFSFGILLYEMLLGEHPFRRSTPMQTAAAILETEPDFPDGSQAGPGGTLHELLVGMLTKDRQGRTESVEQVRQTLEALLEQVTPSPTPRWLLWAAGLAVAVLVSVGAYYLFELVITPSETVELAVLRFETKGDHPQLELLGEEIPDSIINKLSALPGIGVKARSSSFAYEPGSDLRAFAERLGVQRLVTGRLVSIGETFRVSVELMDTEDDRRLWGMRDDWQLAEILATETSIAREIGRALEVQISDEEETRLARRYAANTDAYMAYLRGRSNLMRIDLGQAQIHFEEALAKDPNCAAAYAGIARIHGYKATLGYPLREVLPLIKDAAGKALELDSSLAEAHVALATQKGLEMDRKGAERAHRRAIELNPGLVDGYRFLAINLAKRGRLEEAISIMKKALELDPLSVPTNRNMGWCYYWARSYEEAVHYMRLALETDPRDWASHFFLGKTYAELGQLAEARAEFEAVDCPSCPQPHPYALALLGEREEALRVLEQLEYAKDYAAGTFAALGEIDLAFQWLEKDIESELSGERHSFAASLLKIDPAWDSLRGDPRFNDMLRLMNLEP